MKDVAAEGVALSDGLREPIRYVSVAAVSAASDWCVFTAGILAGAPHARVQLLARAVGGLVSYLLNRSWSFRSGGPAPLLISGGRFLLLSAASAALSIALLYIGVDVLRLSPFVAKPLADATCFVFNFVAMRRYVYREGRPSIPGQNRA